MKVKSVILLCLLTMLNFSAFSQDITTETAKLLASDGASGDFFGRSVSISGDTAIIGAYEDGDNGDYSGSAYIFEKVNGIWTQTAKLLASDGAEGDKFGFSVSISGNNAIIGAFSDYDNGSYLGSAYIFEKVGETWTQTAKLLASDGVAEDEFGFSVSISGNTAIIGSERDDDNGDASGSAYIFQKADGTWAQAAKLLASDGSSYDYFGVSVSISGDTAIIGAVGDDDNGNQSGSAYIFEIVDEIWTQTKKLTAGDGSAIDCFGGSVSISGNIAIIGSGYDDDTGSAYVFEKTGETWPQTTKLLASDRSGGDWFGNSVSIDDNTAIVGANWDDDKGDMSGSAYIFEKVNGTWTQKKKLLASDGSASDNSGCSVSISGNTAIVGAIYDDDKGSSSGSAYLYIYEATLPVILSIFSAD